MGLDMKIDDHRFKGFDKSISIICIALILILSGCSGYRGDSGGSARARRAPSGDEGNPFKSRSQSILIPSALEVVGGSVYTDGSIIHCTVHNPWDTAIAIKPKSIYLSSYIDSPSPDSDREKDFFDDYGYRREEVTFFLNGVEAYDIMYCFPNESYEISFSVAGMTEQEYMNSGVKLLVYEAEPEKFSSDKHVRLIDVY